VETLFWTLEGIGLLTFASSILFLKEGAPVASLNPRNWKPVWKQRDYFRGPGYALQMVGLIWLLVSGIGLVILWLT